MYNEMFSQKFDWFHFPNIKISVLIIQPFLARMMLKVFASPQHLQLSFQKPLKNQAWNWKWLPKFKNCSKRKKNMKKWNWVKIGKICWEKKSNWFRNCNYSNMYYYVKYILIDTAHSVLSQEYDTNSKKIFQYSS